MSGARIISPAKRLLIDQRFSLKVTMLRPWQHATLRAELRTNKHAIFESYGHFIADSQGQLDLRRDPSYGGTYKGIDDMGLFWSMIPAPGERKGLRYIPGNIDKPIDFKIELFHGHVQNTVAVSGNMRGGAPINHGASDPPVKAIATTTVQRTYTAENVERIEIEFGRIRGALFVPKGGGRYPGIIDLFGSHGGLLEHRAALLASHGFAVLALAYFGYKDLPNSHKGLDLEYFIEAVNWFSTHNRVLKTGIGLVGVSLGAQLALQVAAEVSFVKAVVAISPLHSIATPVRYGGEMIGFMRELTMDDVTMVDDVMIGRGIYENDDEMKAFEIKVEKIKGKIMTISGDDDQCIDAAKLSEKIKARLKRHDRPEPTRINFPGTGHLIEPPFMPMCSLSFLREVGLLYSWGGNILEHSMAQEQAWQALIDFLRHNLQTFESKL